MSWDSFQRLNFFILICHILEFFGIARSSPLSRFTWFRNNFDYVDELDISLKLFVVLLELKFLWNSTLKSPHVVIPIYETNWYNELTNWVAPWNQLIIFLILICCPWILSVLSFFVKETQGIWSSRGKTCVKLNLLCLAIHVRLFDVCANYNFNAHMFLKLNLNLTSCNNNRTSFLLTFIGKQETNQLKVYSGSGDSLSDSLSECLFSWKRKRWF